MTDVSTTLPGTDPLVGRTLDEKYYVEERLGAGGMGKVYRARHLSMDRPVAIKFLHQRFVEDEAARLRFHTEARAAVTLRHSNAVSVTDFGQTAEGWVYIVMELLEGRTLREIVSREAPLETARATSIMLQARMLSQRHIRPASFIAISNHRIFSSRKARINLLSSKCSTSVSRSFSPIDDDDANAVAQTKFSYRHAALHVSRAT